MSQQILLAILLVLFRHVNGQSNNNFCPNNMIQLYNGITCQSDQACQRLSNGFFCYRGHCCANSLAMPGGYGSSCSSNNQCSFANAECLGNICYCRTGFSFDGQYCQPSLFNNNPITNTLTTQCPPNEILVGGQCYPLQNYYDECDFNQQCNYVGSICINRKCSCAHMDIFNGFQCVKDSMINVPASCQTTQISINNQCYPIIGIGEPCSYDQQCRMKTNLVGNLACINGVCQQIGGFRPRDQGVVCRNPAATVEMVGNMPKNCISSLCASGYYCEYNASILQYICCGSNTNGPYGQIKMYPGYNNLPLQCNGINSCTFVDFPNCVYSQSYKHNVCCSNLACL